MKTKILLLISLAISSSLFFSTNAQENKNIVDTPKNKYTVSCYGDNEELINEFQVISYRYIDGKLEVEKENYNTPVFIFGNCKIK